MRRRARRRQGTRDSRRPPRCPPRRVDLLPLELPSPQPRFAPKRTTKKWCACSGPCAAGTLMRRFLGSHHSNNGRGRSLRFSIKSMCSANFVYIFYAYIFVDRVVPPSFSFCKTRLHSRAQNPCCPVCIPNGPHVSLDDGTHDRALLSAHKNFC